MTPKTASQIRLMEKAGKIAAEALQYTGKFVKEGISTEELDQIANDFILSKDSKSACIGYHGYPKYTCISVNDIICHGLPSKNQILKNGDIVNIDITALWNGFHGDTSCMFFVGETTARAKRLTECAYQAMWSGIKEVKPGATIGDIGFATDRTIKKYGFFGVKEIGGHGIGEKFHEEPFVPSFGKRGKGYPLLKWGAITVEPMINETACKVIEEEIKDSEIMIYRTSDGSWSAQYEHTVLVTDAGYQVLTQI